MTLVAVVALLFVWPLISLAIILAWLTHVVCAAAYYQVYQGRSLERALGFKHGKLYLRASRGMHSALATRTVVEGGRFLDAGFQQNNVLPDWSITDFFRHLHRNRGHVVDLDVVDGDVDGPPFGNRPRRTLRVPVPTLSEAPPNRADFLEAISLIYSVATIPIGIVVGLFVALEILSGSPLWAQIVTGYLSCAVIAYSGFYAVSFCRN